MLLWGHGFVDGEAGFEEEEERLEVGEAGGGEAGVEDNLSAESDGPGREGKVGGR